jgi:prephenate dehydrogenase
MVETKKDTLSSSTVAILGLGLMGGSLALALRGHCRHLIAIDPDSSTVRKARELNIVPQVFEEPGEQLSKADVLILAAPVRAIISLIYELPRLHSGSPVVMDLGSTKTKIMEAMKTLPKRFDPIGGHPMCGKEKSSLQYAQRELYVGAPFVLTPLGRTSIRARGIATQIVRTVGGVPLWTEHQTHDRTTQNEAAALIGPGFRSTSRLAGSSTQMMMDILITNRSNIINNLQNFGNHLDLIQKCLVDEDYSALERLLAQGTSKYNQLMNHSEIRDAGEGK